MNKFEQILFEKTTEDGVITVRPLSSVGDIRFGMRRDDVRKKLGKFKEYNKTKTSKNSTDAFKKCHVYYDSNNTCKAVEIFEGDVMIGGVKVFPGKFDTAVNIIKRIDPDVEVNDNECTSVNKSIAVQSADGVLKSILFGNDEYYK